MKKYLPFIVLMMTACGSLFGDGSEGEGSASIGDIAPSNDIINFEANFGESTYRSIGFKNSSADPVSITSIVFENNLCNDFSIYTITNASGTVLANGNESLALTVGAGQKIYVNVAYTPSACSYSDYQTTLYVTYQEGSSALSASVILQASGGGIGEEGPFACLEIEDQSTNYAETGLDEPEDGTYYLRVDRMRGYMYLPSLTITVSIADISVGTDINGLEPDDFITPFLEVTASGETITLSQITDDIDFCLPSPEDNQAFGGVMSLLTSSAPFSGTIDSDGNILIEDLNVTIRAEQIPDGLTLGIDADSVFQISLVTDFSTGQVPAEGETVSDTVTEGLTEAIVLTDDNDEPLLPIDSDGDRYYLEGGPLSDGEITLVGVGTFTNDDDTYVGSDLAKQFLIENEAYIFISLDVTVMEKVTTE